MRPQMYGFYKLRLEINLHGIVHNGDHGNSSFAGGLVRDLRGTYQGDGRVVLGDVRFKVCYWQTATGTAACGWGGRNHGLTGCRDASDKIVDVVGVF